MKTLSHIFACLWLSCGWSLAGFILNPYRYVVTGGPSTSYANSGGTGDRTGSITITKSNASCPLSETILLNGTNNSGSSFFGSGIVDGDWFYFDIGSSKIIDEMKWYQQNTSSHGTWKVQGSADAASWADIGSSFTLGGASTQTITTISGNTTAYRYYRLYLITGPPSNVPYLYEIEFKISA